MKPEYWNKGKSFLSNKDRILKNIINNFPKESLILNDNHYHSLVNSIIGQQISVSAANAIKLRFFNLHKKISPRNVLKFEERLLKDCGLSRQKILYIKNISNFFTNNKKFFKNIYIYNEQEIKEKLIYIKGVGNWTADMFLLFSFGSSDIFPQGDLGFIKAISKSYKKELPLSEAYLKKLKKKWSPYNSMATWYLWRSLDPIPVSY
jgi:DNA-3-methyladenine glycosylase II